jgi:predicted MFS family arabinose efflux permease
MSVGCFFGGLRFSGANGLSLEQVPGYSGVMMSFHSASVNVGYLVGAAIGGFSLINFGWNMLSVLLGSAGIIAAIVYWVLTVEPSRQEI